MGDIGGPGGIGDEGEKVSRKTGENIKSNFFRFVGNLPYFLGCSWCYRITRESWWSRQKGILI